MIEKNKQGRGNINVFAAVLTDLSKTFDFINHELLIAKLNAYGFDSLTLKFVSAYLNFRKQITKFDFTSSNYLNILFSIPQGSIAGPLFSIFTFAICFSKMIHLNSPAMQMIIPILLPDRTTKN